MRDDCQEDEDSADQRAPVNTSSSPGWLATEPRLSIFYFLQAKQVPRGYYLSKYQLESQKDSQRIALI